MICTGLLRLLWLLRRIRFLRVLIFARATMNRDGASRVNGRMRDFADFRVRLVFGEEIFPVR